jgi:hypothetical protein
MPWAARLRLLIKRHLLALRGDDESHSAARGPNGELIPIERDTSMDDIAIVLSGPDGSAIHDAIWHIFALSEHIERELKLANSPLIEAFRLERDMLSEIALRLDQHRQRRIRR